MKTLTKLASQRTNTPILNTIQVSGGRAYATNCDQLISYAVSLPDGLYNGPAFDKVQIKSTLPDAPCFPDTVRIGDKLSTMTLTRSGLEFVAGAMSGEEARYYLCGVFFDHTGLVAINGRILLHEEFETGLSADQGNIMPSAAVNFLLDIMKEEKATNCQVHIHKNGFEAYCGRYAMRTKAIDGTFPDYRRVIPLDVPCVGEIDQKEMEKALKETRAICKSMGIRFSWHDPVSNTGRPWIINGAGTMSLEAFPGKAWNCGLKFEEKAGFNPLYLAAMPSGTAYSADSQSPMRIDAGCRLGVIMPVRV